MGIGITSDGRLFRQDRAPRNSVKFPYRAVICGKEHVVKNWNGENLLTDKGQFTFRPLKKNGKSYWPRTECRLLEVAILQPADTGEWLLNGHSLSLLQFHPSGKRLMGIAESEDLRLYKQEIRAVAWYLAVSAGNQTAELDIVLDDWKKAAANTPINTEATQILSRLNSLLFMGWSGPVLLSAFFRSDKGVQTQPDPFPPNPIAFAKFKLPSGKIVEPPDGAREVLQALQAAGSQNVSCQAVKREVARIRGIKEMPADYSPVKVLKGSFVGRSILDEGVVICARKHAEKQSVYTLRFC
jgi:hypothetical protein